MKAYIVTVGSYSDYQIVRVFLDKALAEQYAKLMGMDYTVEEWDVNKQLPHVDVVYCRDIWINKDTGEIQRDDQYVDGAEGEHWLREELERLKVQVRRDEPVWSPRSIQYTIRSLDEERVRKVGSDKIAQERAQLLGL